MGTKSEIIEASFGKVTKQANRKAIIISVIVILLGVVLLESASMLEDNTSSLFMLLSTFGVIAIISGIVLLLFRSKHLVYLPSGSEVKSYSIFFDTAELRQVIDMLDSGRYDGFHKVKRTDNSGIRLDVSVSADDRFAAVQVYQYIPHSYSPASELYCIYDDNAVLLSEHIRKGASGTPQ